MMRHAERGHNGNKSPVTELFRISTLVSQSFLFQCLLLVCRGVILARHDEIVRSRIASAIMFGRNKSFSSDIGDCQRPAGQRGFRTDYEPQVPRDVRIGEVRWNLDGRSARRKKSVGKHMHVGFEWLGRT